MVLPCKLLGTPAYIPQLFADLGHGLDEAPLVQEKGKSITIYICRFNIHYMTSHSVSE
jgi:hypothetical protein